MMDFARADGRSFSLSGFGFVLPGERGVRNECGVTRRRQGGTRRHGWMRRQAMRRH